MQRSTTYLAYIRVSTNEQGAGLEAQKAALDAWATRQGVELEYVSDEGFSGGNANRPGLGACRARLQHRGGPAGLVVSKMDRLSRSILDFSTIVADATRQGWSLVCLAPEVDLSTPAGRLMANVLMTFAQYEREMIGQRTKEALAIKKLQGVRLGRPPAVPTDVRRRIAGDRAQGHTLRSIADSLNADSVPTAHAGRHWHASTVRYVLSTS
jgi:DNA invertase Pin-like site-specific DNA recombinase